MVFHFHILYVNYSISLIQYPPAGATVILVYMARLVCFGSASSSYCAMYLYAYISILPDEDRLFNFVVDFTRDIHTLA